MIGMMPWPAFGPGEQPRPVGLAAVTCTATVRHEIHKTDGTDWTHPEFVGAMADLLTRDPDGVMDGLSPGSSGG